MAVASAESGFHRFHTTVACLIPRSPTGPTAQHVKAKRRNYLEPELASVTDPLIHPRAEQVSTGFTQQSLI